MNYFFQSSYYCSSISVSITVILLLVVTSKTNYNSCHIHVEVTYSQKYTCTCTLGVVIFEGDLIILFLLGPLNSQKIHRFSIVNALIIPQGANSRGGL